MTLKIDIIKTETGYDYRNSKADKLIGTIREGRNKPGIYLWRIPEYDAHLVSGVEQAHYELQHTLAAIAAYIGTELEFANI